jgi:cell wall-associated protease
LKKTILFFSSFLLGAATFAQKPNWQNLDLQTDTVFGISTEKAYVEILSHKKKFRPVVVGVIDSGVDTAHEDLKGVIWTNPKDNTYDQKDNDRDGYTDDVHGWDFIGGPHGDINHENLELTRMIRNRQANSDMISSFNQQQEENIDFLKFYFDFDKSLDTVLIRIGKDTPSLADFEAYSPQNQEEQLVRMRVIFNLKEQPDFAKFRKERVEEAIRHFQDVGKYNLNPGFNPRSIVGDDSLNFYERSYGNPDVTGPTALHGTHVSGIIGAVRDNGIGIQGIADHVWLLSIRTVPDGDERDKDVANAIRYAADHGAKVVNMSFGKAYSPQKKVVDQAVRYAMSKDVLLIHAAGNEGKNLDQEKNYPTRVYADSSGDAGAWIEVGASGWTDDSTLVASFSNYGKRSVDVFAPGVNIYSTIPGSGYKKESGTSMASPVVVGLAALIREYYPKLSAVQVKQIIMQSVIKPAHNIQVRNYGRLLSLPFSEICVSGGIVNVYQALLLAERFPH